MVIKSAELKKIFLYYNNKTLAEGNHIEYCKLQTTWNIPIIKYISKYISSSSDNLLSLGTFLGVLEISLAKYFKHITYVDIEDFVPKWKPKNMVFHKSNLDSSEWKLPEKIYDTCLMIELIEHLLWTPLPLLHWLQKRCKILVVTTPDDNEWEESIYPWTRFGHFSRIPTPFPSCPSNPKPMFHCKQYQQSEFIELFTIAGFRLLEFQRIGIGGHQMLAIFSNETRHIENNQFKVENELLKKKKRNLEEKNIEFESFKKGKIWKILIRYRQLRNSIKSIKF